MLFFIDEVDSFSIHEINACKCATMTLHNPIIIHTINYNVPYNKHYVPQPYIPLAVSMTT